jgi:hypothetical protein
VHDEVIASSSPLERLIRAVGRGEYSEESNAYRSCYDIGQPLVPQIVEKIGAVNWEDLGAPGKVAHFTCLMRLLHDIDESASHELAGVLLRRGCHPVIAARLRSIQSFTLSGFEAGVQNSLTVYVIKTIPARAAVWRHLAEWLSSIPSADLEGIRRLYVIEKDHLPGYLGRYSTGFAVISLVWPPSAGWNRLGLLQAELTLYHEIGHHRDRRKYESRESSEAFADAYAERLFRKVHPWVGTRWVRTFLMPSHTLRKLHRIRRLTQSLKRTPDGTT